MRRILALALLALTLAGGLMTFIASHQAQAHPHLCPIIDEDGDNDHC